VKGRAVAPPEVAPATPLVGICRKCRQIVPAGITVCAENADSRDLRILFSTQFGEHVLREHPEVMEGFRELAGRATVLAAEVAGWLAIGMAESSDADFVAWREEDRARIRAGLEELLSMLLPPS
jgi:hypothetical protein